MFWVNDFYLAVGDLNKYGHMRISAYVHLFMCKKQGEINDFPLYAHVRMFIGNKIENNHSVCTSIFTREQKNLLPRGI